MVKIVVYLHDFYAAFNDAFCLGEWRFLAQPCNARPKNENPSGLPAHSGDLEPLGRYRTLMACALVKFLLI